MSGNKFGPVYMLMLTTAVCFSACKSGPFTVFKSASPHEVYQRKLVSSGLDATAMGKTWIDLSDKILQTPSAIEIPYLEKGYFSPEKVQAAAFSFTMERGQKLSVKLNNRPLEGFVIYTDIWQREEQGSLKILGSSDTVGSAFQVDIDRTSTYILRLQPELLAGGEYTLEITSGPSIAYPLKTYQNNQIRSFWGDGRDANARKHEGIDIFSSFRTPVLASTSGIARVNENNLGGKVVWLRAQGKDFSLYYAHLDEQTVGDGQAVKPGDTLGLMGNTGNARTTPPHLHFGIYTREGAIDPLPFVNPEVRDLPAIKSGQGLVNATVRTIGNASLATGSGVSVTLGNGTIAQVKAVSSNSFRIELPDGTTGFVESTRISSTSKGLQKKKIRSNQLELFDRPDSSAAEKARLLAGQTVNILGSFGNYELVRSEEYSGWIRKLY